MPTNLELKARLDARSNTLRLAKRICTHAGILSHVDTYFRVKKGRLKLREFGRGNGELIYYERNEGEGERWSTYHIVPVKSPSMVKDLLATAIGVREVVKKSRRVFFYKGARIHIDSIKRLGYFIEIEVILKRGRNEARAVFAEIVRLFNIPKSSIIDCSYVDLLERKSKKALRHKKKASSTHLTPG